MGGKLYLQGELDLMRTELRKTEQQGDWLVSQGLRGSIESEGRIGFEGKYSPDGNDLNYEPYDKLDVKLNVAGFKRWDKDLEGNKHLRLDVVGGVNQNMIEGNTVPYLSARQEISGTDLELIGQKFTWSMEAKEGVSYDIKQGDMKANYELFAGLTKKIPMKVFGHDLNTEVKFGPKIKGDIDKPFDVSPVFKVKVRF